jgi:hypothetical protein
MKRILIVAVLGLLGVLGLRAQTSNLPDEYGAMGANYAPNIQPAVSGWAFYAKKIFNEKYGTYSYNLLDITSSKDKPYKLSTAVTPGIAKYLATIGPVKIFGAGNIGVAASGQNVGFAGSFGGAAFVKPWAKFPAFVVPIRGYKSTIGDWQFVVGFGLGTSRFKTAQ